MSHSGCESTHESTIGSIEKQGVSMSILSGNAIKTAIENKTISISPYCESNINPASYDLRLGDSLKVYTFPKHVYYLDPNVCNETKEIKIPDDGMVFQPNQGYLCHTVEVIHTDKFVPIIDGKSSIGRLFVEIHITAGYGDPGFNGQFTLEIKTTHPVKLYPGMRICQVRFHDISGPVSLYNGKYKDQNAMGAVGSRSFIEKKENN